MWFIMKEAGRFASSPQGWQPSEKQSAMKKKASERDGLPMRAEYDFSKGVRGKYARRFKQGTNIVVLEPEIAEVFPDSAAVNDALKALVQIVNRKIKTKRRG